MASALYTSSALAAAPVAARAAGNKSGARAIIAAPAPTASTIRMAGLSSVRSVSASNKALKASVRPTAASAVAASRMVVQASRFNHDERSYIMIKPDGVQRGLVGDIIGRFESKGFVMKGLKVFDCPKELAEEHYKDLSDKPFFGDLVDYICSGPVVCMIWQGNGVVKSGRKLIGATNPLESEPGTIRGDFAVEVGRNVIHGSDSPENGEREIGLWFADGAGMVDWEPTILPWVRE